MSGSSGPPKVRTLASRAALRVEPLCAHPGCPIVSLAMKTIILNIATAFFDAERRLPLLKGFEAGALHLGYV